MSNSETSDSRYVAVGTSTEPFLLVRNDLADLKSALDSAGALDEEGQPLGFVGVFYFNGTKISTPFPDEWDTSSLPPEDPPSDEDKRMFYARVASVLAAQAALAADVAAGENQLEAAFRRCTCCWCYLGFHC